MIENMNDLMSFLILIFLSAVGVWMLYSASIAHHAEQVKRREARYYRYYEESFDDDDDSDSSDLYYED